MFEYAQFVVRNPTYVTKNARSQWGVRKALLKHRKENPQCAATGETRWLEVHHKVPVSVAPNLADQASNLVTLTRKAHLMFGHAGNHKHYVVNVMELCEIIQIQRTTGAK